MATTSDTNKNLTAAPPDPVCSLPCTKAYLMGKVLVHHDTLLQALKTLGVEATVFDESSQDWAADIDFKTSILIFNEFSGTLFDAIRKKHHSRIYGPPVLIETADLSETKLPVTKSRYPIYCRLLKSCKISVTGVTSREALHALHRYILYMDGTYLEKEGVVTHLLANKCTGSKYRGAVALGRPVLKTDWVYEVWKQRENYKFNCNSIMDQFKLPVFYGLRMVFLAFDEPERSKMMKLAEDNGGTIVQADDQTASHIVKGLTTRAQDGRSLHSTPIRSGDVSITMSKGQSLSNPSPLKRPRFEPQVLNDLTEETQDIQPENDINQNAVLLKSEWFWSSIQIDACADEQMYIANPVADHDGVNCSVGTISFTSPVCILSDPDTPGSESFLLSGGGRRKRKRGQEFGQIDSTDFSSSNILNLGDTTTSSSSSSKSNDKRREISDAEFGISLKQINEFLSNPDYQAMTPRHREFAHLLETERNYVLILHTIVKNFKEPCENEDQAGGRILDSSEVREIFGDILPIYNLHRHLLYELAELQRTWTEETLIGKVFCDHESEFRKAYKQFVNYFEDCKAAIGRYEKEKPRFLAVIRIAQGRAECGKQSLAELMIRPVQRLPSTALILDRLKKHTNEDNPDFEWTSKALEVMQQANQNINEEKKRNEVLHAIYELDMKVDGLPPLVVSSHRQIEAVLDVQSLNDAFGQKFESITLFAFNDKLMVVKRRNSAINKNHLAGVSSIANIRSPAMSRKSIAIGSLPTHSKPYKFLELIPYDSIKRVIDIKDGIPSFGFVVRDEGGMRDRTIAFTTPDDPKWSNKAKLLELFIELTTKAGNNERTVPVNMLQAELKPRSSDSTVLEKASKFASKTRHKVTRALSLSRTPSKLRRTMSQMMSPFSSSKNHIDDDTLSHTSECSTTPLRNNLSSISLWGWGSRRGIGETPKSRRTLSAKESRSNIKPIHDAIEES